MNSCTMQMQFLVELWAVTQDKPFLLYLCVIFVKHIIGRERKIAVEKEQAYNQSQVSTGNARRAGRWFLVNVPTGGTPAKLKPILHYAFGLRFGKVCELKTRAKTQEKRNWLAFLPYT